MAEAFDCVVAEAVVVVVVDHACGLHEGVDDERADELEATLLELFRHGGCEVGLRGAWAFGLDGLVADHVPEKGGEAFAGLLHLKEDLCATDGGDDLGAGADDAWIVEETQDVFLFEAGHLMRIECAEGSLEGFAFAQDDEPGEAGLEALEHEEFPERATVVLGNAPLVVVVFAHECVIDGPGAARLVVGFGGCGGHAAVDADARGDDDKCHAREVRLGLLHGWEREHDGTYGGRPRAHAGDVRGRLGERSQCCLAALAGQCENAALCVAAVYGLLFH